jgi:RNA polymerase sigma-70 factor (ECF subfamily)
VIIQVISRSQRSPSQFDFCRSLEFARQPASVRRHNSQHGSVRMKTGSSEVDPGGGERFVTTHWSAVMRGGGGDSAAAREALAELCQTYWYPLYCFIRRQGRTPHEAEDLTQGFFARLLEKNFVSDAHQARGKFRSFLLVALKGFLANEWDRQHAQKRGGFQTAVEMDQAMAEVRLDAELKQPLTPEKLFERQWALMMLERTMSQLREEYTVTGRAKLFEHLSAGLAQEPSAISYAEIARELHLTEASVKQASYRLRARYREILRGEIGKTVSSPQEIDDELRFLFACFGN